MAPKQKKAGRTLVKTTTRKVVEETVQVAVLDDDENITQVAGDEVEREEIIDSRPPFQEPIRTVVVEDRTPETAQKVQAPDDSETGEIPSSIDAQMEENEPEKKQEQGKPTEDQAQEKEKTGLKKERKRRRVRRGERGRGEGYKIYVFRVLKQVHPGMGISSKAMTVVNNLMSDMFERLADEATRLSKYTGKTTMSSREIQGAVKLVLPGDLGKHAIAEGAKAITSFMSYNTKKG